MHPPPTEIPWRPPLPPLAQLLGEARSVVSKALGAGVGTLGEARQQSVGRLEEYRARYLPTVRSVDKWWVACTCLLAYCYLGTFRQLLRAHQLSLAMLPSPLQLASDLLSCSACALQAAGRDPCLPRRDGPAVGAGVGGSFPAPPASAEGNDTPPAGAAGAQLGAGGGVDCGAESGERRVRSWTCAHGRTSAAQLPHALCAFSVLGAKRGQLWPPS